MSDVLAQACRERADLLAQSPVAATAVALLRNAVRIVRLADRRSELAARAADVGAAAAGAAALLARGAAAGDAAFTVRLDWGGALPESAGLSLPAGPAEFSPSDWLQGFAMAALARDAAALGIVTAQPTLVALEQLAAPGEPSWTLRVAPMLAAAAHRDAQAAREAGGAAAPPAVADAGAGPRALWQAARRLAEEGADASLAKALQPALDDEATALAAHALISLDGGAPPPARLGTAPTLQVHHALHAVPQGDEARWFLDLAGYPRAARRHRIVRRTLGVPPVEQLVACYEMQATAGMPFATAEFVLLDPAAPPGDLPAPLALDAGQLLWLAELLASGDPAPAMLDEAAGCARAALQGLGSAERLAETQLASPQGRALWRADPGRFSRERLTAYADALAAALAARRDAVPVTDPDAAAAGDEVEAFRRALRGAEAVKQAVAPLLEALRHGGDADGLVARLRPQAQDYDKVFTAAASAMAREAYEAMWSQPAGLFRAPAADQAALQVFVAPAGLLDSDVDLVRPFPQGYRTIAPLLDPHRVWVCWKYSRAEAGSGLAYDGLVWCDDHWAWFPKPWRVLAPLAER